jgi:F-type H+-transporting ATPase subunit b
MSAPFVLAVAESGGFNPLDFTQGGNAFWTWLIFLVALVPIWKLVLGPITRSMTERDQRATEAIEAAKKASADAERARAEVETKLAEARAESARMVAEARARAEVREREIVAAAGDQAKALLESARREIQSEQAKAISAIREEVVDLSLAAAKAVIQRRADSADDRRLVGELVGQMKSGAARVR